MSRGMVPRVDALARLRAGAPVAVVLGGGGAGHDPTEARAHAAAALGRTRPDLVLILSGSHASSDAREPVRSEAARMRDVLVAAGIAPDRLLLEEESRDTLGNAAFTAARFLAGVAPGPLVVVTSPFHLRRATRIFERVLGPRWTVTGLASEPGPDEPERARAEAELEHDADAFFAGLEPGDLAAIAARLRTRYPYSLPERGGTWST